MKFNKPIRAGTRGSLLALKQVEEIIRLVSVPPSVPFKVVIFDTNGDKDKKTPLTAQLPDDFFTDTLDQALLKRKIDVAVHSAKDLPQTLAEGLSIFALTESVDDRDAFVGVVPFKKLKAGSRVGTSSPLRQKSVEELNPKINAVSIRGTIDERLAQFDKGKLDGIIVAACALKRLGLSKRITEIMPWEATPLQGQLAVVGRSDDAHLQEMFSSIDARAHYGKVYLVGAGPGDSELITLKGINALKQADVVFYDYLINKELLRHAQKAQKIYVGKRKGAHTLPQSELNKLIKDKAVAGKSVVRLKGGDPLVFGRGGDEIGYLRSYHIEVEVVPGVSSATGIPSGLGIPLTARGVSDSVAFVSGHSEGESQGKKKRIQIPKAQTLIFLMGLTKLKEIVAQLTRQGWKKQTPVIVVSKGTFPDERIVAGSLEDIIKKTKSEKLLPPALIMVGETIHSYRPRQKRSKTVLYTGTNPQKYKRLGKLVHLPMIEITPVEFTRNKRISFLKAFQASDMVLLTSRFAVRFLFDILKKERIGARSLQDKPFITIGRETARELIGHGITPELTAQEESSVGLWKEMRKKYQLNGKRILFPRSALPNPYLKQALRKAGAIVKEITVYQNRMPKKRKLPRVSIDEVIFTSPSTVNNFLKSYGTIPRIWRIKSRGELTRRSLEKAGFESEVIN